MSELRENGFEQAIHFTGEDLPVDWESPVDEAPRLLSVTDAADRLGVSAASLRKWSDEGLVPVFRTPGGQRRYMTAELDAVRESWRERPNAS